MIKSPQERQQDVEDELKKDYEVFNNRPYNGFIPDGLMDKFKVALMVNAPGTHQYNPNYLKILITKTEGDLNFIDFGLIVNLLIDTPFEKIFITLEEAIDYLESLLKSKIEYNAQGKEFERKMMAKKKTLEKLYGLDKSTTGLNGNHLRAQ